MVERLVQLGALGDPVVVDRQLGSVACEFEQDARDPGGERGGREPAALALGCAEQAPEVAEEG